MSGTLNKVMLIGHLGDNVKMHYFDGGGSIGRFPLATNESYTKKDTGEKVTQTEWHNIVVRNKAAEVCEKYLSKGDRVYIEGKIKPVNGKTKQVTTVTVLRMLMILPLTTKGSSEGGESSPSTAPEEKTTCRFNKNIIFGPESP